MALQDKIDQSIALINKTERLALQYSENGFHLAFSGGKDSQVIYELAKMSGVKFKPYFYKTSIDPKELLRFIRNNYPDVFWLKPEYTMFQLILKKGMLPLRQARFCCEFLKERNGLNEVVITGIRKEESNKRKNRNSWETSCKFGCDKNLVNPILEWKEVEVWEFLKNRGVQISELYETQKRIGCIGCPMSPKTMRRDFRNMPNFKKAYVNTVKKLMVQKGKYPEFESAEDVVDWWSSGLSRKVWMANKKQYTIEYY